MLLIVLSLIAKLQAKYCTVAKTSCNLHNKINKRGSSSSMTSLHNTLKT